MGFGTAGATGDLDLLLPPSLIEKEESKCESFFALSGESSCETSLRGLERGEWNEDCCCIEYRDCFGGLSEVSLSSLSELSADDGEDG